MTTAVVWFRRDLRVRDNPALAEAGSDAACVFVAEPAWLAFSPARSAYLAAAIEGLASDLRARGGSLAIRTGPAERTIPALARAAGAEVVHAAADHTPRARGRDEAVAEALARVGIELRLHTGVCIVEPGAVRRAGGGVFKVFTPYHRRWLEAERRRPATAPRRLRAVRLPGRTASLPRPHRGTVPASTGDAMRALDRFLRRDAARYDDARHSLDGAGSSRLSPAFRFGVLSPLEASSAAGEADAGGWVRQLAWRDFSYETVHQTPAILRRSLRMPPRPWRRDAAALAAWVAGETGEAGVDAAMRQLAAEGWISNRARMLVASYLTRDLRLDWRDGAHHFMRTLIDGDPAVNALNWQWVAGTGYDAPAPFWRLAPDRQTRRYDPDGRWVAAWGTA